MAYTDTREPGVYVDIEDLSYMQGSVLDVGRTVYSVILCDRGPSNVLTYVRSQSEFQRLFGTPNFLRTSQTHYQVDAALRYTSNVLVARIVPKDSYLSNVAIKENSAGTDVNAYFKFTKDDNKVTVTPASGDSYGSSTMYGEGESSFVEEINKIQIGSWIYGATDDPSLARQVVAREYNDTDQILTLTLDANYEGETSDDQSHGMIYIPFEFKSLVDIKDKSELINESGDTVFQFYAVGTGKYYDNICIRGTRNTDLEKYYLDDDGKPMYKYMFMNIAVYEKQPNGNIRRIEGPWVCSLIPRYPDGTNQVVNPTTGKFCQLKILINMIIA